MKSTLTRSLGRIHCRMCYRLFHRLLQYSFDKHTADLRMIRLWSL